MSNKITREEYLKALDIVEAYHKQVFMLPVKPTDEGRMTVEDWLIEKATVPSRVHDALTYSYIDHRDGATVIRFFEYMDEVKKGKFLKAWNVGKKAWIDFYNLLTPEEKQEWKITL